VACAGVQPAENGGRTVPAVPDVLGGRYEVERELGTGGMAIVVEGRDRVLGRRVAIKVLFPHLAADPTFTSRFRREAQSAARLSHPNVVGVFDVGSQDSGRPDEIDFIVMELVDGRTLRQILEEERPLAADRATAVARDVCAALDVAHGHGLVHRDIKPANVMITTSGQVKVMDFGIARAADADRLTQTGLAIGTAQYASPEQLRGREVDSRSDIYSLGCCLYEMLTGAPPFTGSSPIAVAYRQVSEAPVPVREHNPAVPAGLAALVARAMEKDPGRRHQTAAAMGHDLQRLLTGQQSALATLAAAGPLAAHGAGPDGTGADGAGADGSGTDDTGPAEAATGAHAGDGSTDPLPAATDVPTTEPGKLPSRRRHAVLAGVLATLCLAAAAAGVWLFGGEKGSSGGQVPAISQPAGPTERSPSTSAAPAQTEPGAANATQPVPSSQAPRTTEPARTTSASPPPTTAPRTTSAAATSQPAATPTAAPTTQAPTGRATASAPPTTVGATQ
jgi:eukaryotic-like serine/threonine-protein kinase